MSWLFVLCLAAGNAHAEIPVHQFTLRWQHSIEKIDWEEDYVVAGHWLFLESARVRGSGAGMEPPVGSYYSNGVWRYRPAPNMRWSQSLLLTRSEFARDYDICIQGRCRPMADWVPIASGNTTLTPCKVASNAGQSER